MAKIWERGKDRRHESAEKEEEREEAHRSTHCKLNKCLNIFLTCMDDDVKRSSNCLPVIILNTLFIRCAAMYENARLKVLFLCVGIVIKSLLRKLILRTSVLNLNLFYVSTDQNQRPNYL